MNRKRLKLKENTCIKPLSCLQSTELFLLSNWPTTQNNASECDSNLVSEWSHAKETMTFKRQYANK